MFGGIIRHQGRVVWIDQRLGKLRILSSALTRRLAPGDSISVDGICLTVTARRGDVFFVDITPETIRRTRLRWTRRGSVVNLELPLRLGDRIHGHPVLGHVDGVGRVNSKDVGGGMSIAIPWRLTPYVSEKGSVAINGVSLTIARLRGNLIQIALIPETLRQTNLRFLMAGYRVNVEVDVMARYSVGKIKNRKTTWKNKTTLISKRR